MDLTGPHIPAICAGSQYALVAVFNASESGANLPFVRGPTSTMGAHNFAIYLLLAELNSVLGERTIMGIAHTRQPVHQQGCG